MIISPLLSYLSHGCLYVVVEVLVVILVLDIVVVAMPRKVRCREGRYGAPPQDGEPKVDVVKAGTALHPKLAPLNRKGPRAHASYIAHNHKRILQ